VRQNPWDSVSNTWKLRKLPLVIELSTGEGVRVKSDRVRFAFQVVHWYYCSESIIQGIGFHDQGLVGFPVHEDWSCGKRDFQIFERFTTIIWKKPGGPFMGETGERDSNVWVIVDKTTIIVSKTKEGLNIFDLLRFGPFMNDFDCLQPSSGLQSSRCSQGIQLNPCAIHICLLLLMLCVWKVDLIGQRGHRGGLVRFCEGTQMDEAQVDNTVFIELDRDGNNWLVQ